MAKHNTEDIRRIFKEYNKTVDPDFEYKSSQDKVPYTCDLCKHRHSILLRNLKKGGYGEGYKNGCKYCIEHKKIDYPTSLEELKESFELEDYEIINVEGNPNKNCYIYSICPNGHDYKIRRDYWYRGHRCDSCKRLERNPSRDIRFFTFKGNSPLTMCYIKEAAHDYGFRLLSVGKYDGDGNNKLDFKCIRKGHKIKLSINDLRNKKSCYICKQEDLFKKIRKLFNNEGYTFLIDLEKEYKDQQTFFKCIHNECGHKFETNWSRFGYHRQRCPKCARAIQGEKKSGQNHFNWKGGISTEPYPFGWGDKKFKKYIFERDGHKCWHPDCKNKFSRLVRHHIDYNKKNCDPVNIITLCCSCHTLTNYDRDKWEVYFKDLMKNRFEKAEKGFENK